MICWETLLDAGQRRSGGQVGVSTAIADLSCPVTAGIVIAGAVNSLVKAGMATVIGGRRIGVRGRCAAGGERHSRPVSIVVDALVIREHVPGMILLPAAVVRLHGREQSTAA